MKLIQSCFLKLTEDAPVESIIEKIELYGYKENIKSIEEKKYLVCCTDAEPVYYFSDKNPVDKTFIDCGTDFELFKVLATLTDDDIYNKYFIVKEDYWQYKKGEIYKGLCVQSNIHPDFYRSCTAEEIIKHYKNTK